MSEELPVGPARAASRRIIAVLLLLSPLDQIAFDIYTPALPMIGDQFAASNDVVQNTVTAYALGMTLVVLPVGLLADALGRKRLLLAALGLIAVTSVGCAFTGSLGVLLVLRFLQGLGGGSCLLLAAAIAADRFHGAKLVSVLGLMGAAWGAAPVLAPAFGGFIVQMGSWRWVFAILAAIAVLALTLAATVLPETLPPDRRTPLDLRASAGVIGNALRHRVFMSFVLMFGLVAAAQMMFAVVGPFLFQDGLGFAPGSYGLIALAIGLANLAGALTCGWLAQRTTTRRLGLAAWVLLTIGAATLIVSAQLRGIDALTITVGASITLFAIGVLDPLSKGLAMGVFDSNIGLIAGMVNTSCYLLITLAMALLAYLPETSQAPLGWCYLAAATAFGLILLLSVPRGQRSQPPESPAAAAA